MQEFHTLPVRLDGDSSEKKREEIRRYFQRSFELFESLFDLLKDDSVFYEKSEPTRHPMLFYFGHTATFYVNKLILGKVIEERINPEFESIFAIGVDEMEWDDMRDEHYRWPDVKDVRAYRRRVRALVERLIDTLPLNLPITQESPWWIILMGIEHERIHIETSSVLHRQMPLDRIVSSQKFTICDDTAGRVIENRMIAIEGGGVDLGKPRGHYLYGWDNEYGVKHADVAPFKASRHLVSNAEYMAFVMDGGYDDPSWWDEEGRMFLRRSGAKHPLFWIEHAGDGFRYRALDREIAMPLTWPVEVNCLEAAAFCRYKSAKEHTTYRLPTEAEWYRMLETSDAVSEDVFTDDRANLNFRHFASSVPVDRFNHGSLYDVVGNVWQWTATPIDGFEGFEPHSVYDDFSVPTFDGKHNIIKGGSWASTGNEITRHSRYAFRRHFYQHAGFRYVEAAPLDESEAFNVYETDALVSQYCEFQYGPDYFEVKNFARACAEYAIALTKETPQSRALDLGCATGRASFELARVFDDVTGIDFSARFIQVGVAMRDEGSIAYERLEEGEIVSRHTRTLAELGLEETASRVQFWQGDACNLKTHFAGYDLVLATNLIDRLYEPKLFLNEVHTRLNDGGILILTSPYTWLEEYTDKANWVGGYYDSHGNEVRTIDALQTLLESHFERVDVLDVPFVIRESARKYQHTVAQMSVWKKR